MAVLKLTIAAAVAATMGLSACTNPDGTANQAGTGAKPHLAARNPGASNKDIEIHVAVTIEVAERASIRATTFVLEFGDDLHAAHFRAAGDRAARKHGGDYLPGRDVVAQLAAYVGHDVVHVRLAFHGHQFIDANAARTTHATQVVALQVDQHHVFGTFLRMANQFPDSRGIVVAGNARPGSSDRTRFDYRPANGNQSLRR